MNFRTYNIDPPAPNTQKQAAGDPGIWVFIFGDMFVFALFFIAYVYERSNNIELYNASQSVLSVSMGTLNTLALLTSSLFVALAVNALKIKSSKIAPSTYFLLAIGCGVYFIINKIIEWSDKVSLGYTLTKNEFFTYYYMLSGIHLLHVIIGLMVLTSLWLRSKSDDKKNSLQPFETGATYWHMVDFLWLILFPLLYLMK